MAILDLLQEITEVVEDVIQLDFNIVKTQGHYVPGYEDPGLSFERGIAKKSKTICTCVLYVDIRNSTTLSHSHSHETMARLYTAFTKTILRIADHHGAVVRNIIGDRVMLVFPQDDCFRVAINTAISVNTASKYIINKLFANLKFEVGIGIDYGEMMIVKAGIPKKEPERTNYKNLIWIGKPANIASKLTDVANKQVKRTYFKVLYNAYNFYNLFPIKGLFSIPYSDQKTKNDTMFNDSISEDLLTEIEFAEKIGYNDTLGITYSGGKFIKFTKEEKTNNDPPILMTEKVYEEFKAHYPNDNMIKENYLKVQQVIINDYTGKIYGGDVNWTDYKKIKF